MTNHVKENENQHKTDINTKWREHIIQASLNFVKNLDELLKSCNTKYTRDGGTSRPPRLFSVKGVYYNHD